MQWNSLISAQLLLEGRNGNNHRLKVPDWTWNEGETAIDVKRPRLNGRRKCPRWREESENGNIFPLRKQLQLFHPEKFSGRKHNRRWRTQPSLATVFWLLVAEEKCFPVIDVGHHCHSLRTLHLVPLLTVLFYSPNHQSCLHHPGFPTLDEKEWLWIRRIPSSNFLQFKWRRKGTDTLARTRNQQNGFFFILLIHPPLDSGLRRGENFFNNMLITLFFPF